MALHINEGDEVFLHEGEKAFGSVMHAPKPGATEVIVYIEDAGEFRIPIKAVKAAHDGKVMLNKGMLHAELLEAIEHAHDEEDDLDHDDEEDKDGEN